MQGSSEFGCRNGFVVLLRGPEQYLTKGSGRYNANIEAINSFTICIVMGMRRSTTTSRALQPSSPQMMTHDDTSVTILFEPDAW